MNDLVNQLAQLISTNLLKQPKKEITPDEAIISSGLVDSFSLVDLSILIEEHFGVLIDDNELNPETFDTLNQLADLIQSRQ